jgi:hypothetical protein
MATNNKVTVENLTLLQAPIVSFLTQDTAYNVTSLIIKNITGFVASPQIIMVGELGNEGTELIKTTSTSTTGGVTTITTATNTLFPHSSGTPIYILDYDQIEFSTALTTTGTKTVLATIPVQVDSLNTIYNDTVGSIGFYFARFKNTINSAVTGYSDPIPTGGYPINSARQIIDNALGMINKQTSELLTDTFCFNEINNCQMEVLREYKRWSFMQVFDYSLGQLSTGQWRVAVPANLDDQNTNKSIYNFHIGTMDDLVWIDKQKWNEIIQGVAHTTLASNINVSDASITLTDASNFDPNGGSIYIGANIYGYSAVTGNSLTLNSVSTTTNTAGQDVFQGASLGMPTYWTTFGGYLYFYPVLGSTYTLREGILDYYIAPQPIINDSDTIVLPDPNVVVFYLAWKCLLKINNGVDDASTHPMYDSYDARKQTLMRKEVIGRTVQMHPLKNSLIEENNVDNKAIRTGAFPNSFY